MNSNRTSVRLGEIARKIGAHLEGDAEVVIYGASPLSSAGDGEISFFANKKYRPLLATTRAAAIVIDPETPCPGHNLLRHPQPYLAFALILDLLHPDRPSTTPGIHPSAVVHAQAQVHPSASIGPLCHLDAAARVGENSRLISSVYLGPEAVVGANCLIYPGVVVMDGCRVGDNVSSTLRP